MSAITESLSFKQRMHNVLGTHHWPYGAEEKSTQLRLLKWAEERGLRYSPHGRCLHWIGQGRCTGDYCLAHFPWMDHTTGWSRQGRAAVLLCQPYHIYADDLDQIKEAANAFALYFHISKSGWYGLGTFTIELFPTTNLRWFRGGIGDNVFPDAKQITS